MHTRGFTRLVVDEDVAHDAAVLAGLDATAQVVLHRVVLADDGAALQHVDRARLARHLELLRLEDHAVVRLVHGRAAALEHLRAARALD